MSGARWRGAIRWVGSGWRMAQRLAEILNRAWSVPRPRKYHRTEGTLAHRTPASDLAVPAHPAERGLGSWIAVEDGWLKRPCGPHFYRLSGCLPPPVARCLSPSSSTTGRSVACLVWPDAGSTRSRPPVNGECGMGSHPQTLSTGVATLPLWARAGSRWVFVVAGDSGAECPIQTKQDLGWHTRLGGLAAFSGRSA